MILREGISRHDRRGCSSAAVGPGEVFGPIPPRKKGTPRPGKPEISSLPDVPVFEAYLEADHDYGVARRGDLAR